MWITHDLLVVVSVGWRIIYLILKVCKLLLLLLYTFYITEGVFRNLGCGLRSAEQHVRSYTINIKITSSANVANW